MKFLEEMDVIMIQIQQFLKDTLFSIAILNPRRRLNSLSAF